MSEEDNLRYLKKLDNGYIKKIHFLENHVKIFKDKFNINRQDFYLSNVRNGDSIFIYGILDANKIGLNYDLPSVKFNEPCLLIDNVRFENEIPNDISAYKSLKSKSMYSDNKCLMGAVVRKCIMIYSSFYENFYESFKLSYYNEYKCYLS